MGGRLVKRRNGRTTTQEHNPASTRSWAWPASKNFLNSDARAFMPYRWSFRSPPQQRTDLRAYERFVFFGADEKAQNLRVSCHSDRACPALRGRNILVEL